MKETKTKDIEKLLEYRKKSEKIGKKIKEAEEIFDVHLDLVSEMHKEHLKKLRAEKEKIDNKLKELELQEIEVKGNKYNNAIINSNIK